MCRAGNDGGELGWTVEGWRYEGRCGASGTDCLCSASDTMPRLPLPLSLVRRARDLLSLASLSPPSLSLNHDKAQVVSEAAKRDAEGEEAAARALVAEQVPTSPQIVLVRSLICTSARRNPARCGAKRDSWKGVFD